jgi:hypothetical protein
MQRAAIVAPVVQLIIAERAAELDRLREEMAMLCGTHKIDVARLKQQMREERQVRTTRPAVEMVA